MLRSVCIWLGQDDGAYVCAFVAVVLAALVLNLMQENITMYDVWKQDGFFSYTIYTSKRILERLLFR